MSNVVYLDRSFSGAPHGAPQNRAANATAIPVDRQTLDRLNGSLSKLAHGLDGFLDAQSHMLSDLSPLPGTQDLQLEIQAMKTSLAAAIGALTAIKDTVNERPPDEIWIIDDPSTPSATP